MTHTVRVFAVALLVCLAATATAREEPGGLLIETISAETRRPLADVRVTVTDRDGRAVEGVTTADGIVEFDALDPGLYAVTAEGPGLVTARAASWERTVDRLLEVYADVVAREPAIAV